jgi:hypothetical protein
MTVPRRGTSSSSSPGRKRGTSGGSHRGTGSRSSRRRGKRNPSPYLIDLDRLAREEGVGTQVTTGPEAVRRGLGIARKAETHAIAFYAEAGKIVEDPSTKTLLAELEGEERNHLAKIEGYLADLPPAPL